MIITLVFPSLDELESYLDAVHHNGFVCDYKNLSLTGNFEERDLELAEHVFHAIIIETK